MSMRVDQPISFHKLSIGEQRTLPTLDQSPRADTKTQDVIGKPDSPLPERRSSLKLGSARIVDAQIQEKVIPSSRDKEVLTAIENETQKMAKSAETSQATRRSSSPINNRKNAQEKHLGLILQPSNGGVLVTAAELQIRQSLAPTNPTSRPVSQERTENKESSPPQSTRLSPRQNSIREPSTPNFSPSMQKFVNEYFDLVIVANKLNDKLLPLSTKLNEDLTKEEGVNKQSLTKQKEINNKKMEKLEKKLRSLSSEQQFNVLKSTLAEMEKMEPQLKAIDEKNRHRRKNNKNLPKTEVSETEQYMEAMAYIRGVLIENPKVAVAEARFLRDKVYGKDNQLFNQIMHDFDHGIIYDKSIATNMLKEMNHKIEWHKTKMNKIADSKMNKQMLEEQKIHEQQIEKLKKDFAVAQEKFEQISSGDVDLNKILNKQDEASISNGNEWVKTNLAVFNELKQIDQKLDTLTTTLKGKEKESEEKKHKIVALTDKITEMKSQIGKLNSEREKILQTDRLEAQFKDSTTNFKDLAKNNPDAALAILSGNNTRIAYLQERSNFFEAQIGNLQKTNSDSSNDEKIAEYTEEKNKINQEAGLRKQLLICLLQPDESKESEKIQKNLVLSLYQSSRKALTEALKNNFGDPSIKQSTVDTAMHAFQACYELTQKDVTNRQYGEKFVSPFSEEEQTKFHKDFEELQSRIQRASTIS